MNSNPTLPACPCTPKVRGRVILIHGFNVSDEGEGTVGKLGPMFEAAGYTVKRPRYGWRGLLGVRALNKTFSRMITDMSEPGDIAVCHSNGAAIAAEAADLGAPFSQLVLINPALDHDRRFPRQLDAIHVWHSPSDGPLKFARLLPWHSWGNMGAVGYRGPADARVTNYNKQSDFRVSSSAHSDIFEDEKLFFFGPLILQAVNQYRSP
jgi:hypothetical protein